jgi:hypothetical protein
MAVGKERGEDASASAVHAVFELAREVVVLPDGGSRPDTEEGVYALVREALTVRYAFLRRWRYLWCGVASAVHPLPHPTRPSATLCMRVLHR